MSVPYLALTAARRWLRHGRLALSVVALALFASQPVQAMSTTPAPPKPKPLPADTLPPTVLAALAKARLPADALAAVVVDAAPAGQTWLNHRARAPVNPASTAKLVTTFAALDLLGPAYTWRTPVLTDGPVRDGVLLGNLYLQGRGDPKLVTERLWLLMRRVQGLGIRRIAGDIVLDRSAFELPPHDPGAFDGEHLRPYNAAPDALLVNYKSVVMTFTPDPQAGVARVSVEPPLANSSWPETVPLDTAAAPCADWRQALRTDFTAPRQPQFRGRYPASCGERLWPLAHPEPERLAALAIAGMWQALGNRLDGSVRDGRPPSEAALRFEFESPTLAEVVRDVNKFSNNVMAQQVYLTLGLGPDGSGPASFASAERALQAWWRQRMDATLDMPQMDNGSGLSRDTRTTAAALAHLLQSAYASGMMPELMASLPASGLDGTLRRSQMGEGLAHLKTGSLRDVQALAGYVHGRQGQRRVLVAVVNHPNAIAARPALEALVQWAAGW